MIRKSILSLKSASFTEGFLEEQSWATWEEADLVSSVIERQEAGVCMWKVSGEGAGGNSVRTHCESTIENVPYRKLRLEQISGVSPANGELFRRQQSGVYLLIQRAMDAIRNLMNRLLSRQQVPMQGLLFYGTFTPGMLQPADKKEERQTGNY